MQAAHKLGHSVWGLGPSRQGVDSSDAAAEPSKARQVGGSVSQSDLKSDDFYLFQNCQTWAVWADGVYLESQASNVTNPCCQAGLLAAQATDLGVASLTLCPTSKLPQTQTALPSSQTQNLALPHTSCSCWPGVGCAASAPAWKPVPRHIQICW